MPTAWWLRPVSSAWRVGEHNAVVWKRLNRSPCPARRSNVGVSHGPPNALDEPNPASSSMTTNTFGAPAGGRTGSIGGYAVSGSFASNVVSPTCVGSGIGKAERETSDEDTVGAPCRGANTDPNGADPREAMRYRAEPNHLMGNHVGLKQRRPLAA